MLNRLSRGLLAVAALFLLSLGNYAMAGISAGPLSGLSPVIPDLEDELPTVVIQEFGDPFEGGQYSIRIAGPLDNPWSIVAFGVTNPVFSFVDTTRPGWSAFSYFGNQWDNDLGLFEGATSDPLNYNSLFDPESVLNFYFLDAEEPVDEGDPVGDGIVGGASVFGVAIGPSPQGSFDNRFFFDAAVASDIVVLGQQGNGPLTLLASGPISAVPVPASVLMLGSALFVFAALRRRQRKGLSA